MAKRAGLYALLIGRKASAVPNWSVKREVESRSRLLTHSKRVNCPRAAPCLGARARNIIIKTSILFRPEIFAIVRAAEDARVKWNCKRRQAANKQRFSMGTSREKFFAPADDSQQRKAPTKNLRTPSSEAPQTTRRIAPQTSPLALVALLLACAARPAAGSKFLLVRAGSAVQYGALPDFATSAVQTSKLAQLRARLKSEAVAAGQSEEDAEQAETVLADPDCTAPLQTLALPGVASASAVALGDSCRAGIPSLYVADAPSQTLRKFKLSFSGSSLSVAGEGEIIASNVLAKALVVSARDRSVYYVPTADAKKLMRLPFQAASGDFGTPEEVFADATEESAGVSAAAAEEGGTTPQPGVISLASGGLYIFWSAASASGGAVLTTSGLPGTEPRRLATPSSAAQGVCVSARNLFFTAADGLHTTKTSFVPWAAGGTFFPQKRQMNEY